MSNALSTPPPIGTVFSPQTFDQLVIAVNALYGTLTGQGDKSGIAEATGFDSDDDFAWTIQNQGTGGHLNIPNRLVVTDALVTIAPALLVAGGVTVNGGLHATGAVDFDSTLNVDGATTLTTLHATGATTLDGAVTLGDAAGDLITVNGTPTFNTAVLFAGNITVNGDTALGNANTDLVTVIGVSTFRNAANTLTQLFVDAGNNRVIVGSATALAADTTPNLQVIGRLYVAPDTANDLAMELRRSAALTTPAIRLGVTATGELVVKDETDTVLFQAGGATYAFDVTGDARVSDDFVVGTRAVIGGTTWSGAEELRVVGQTRLEGTTTVTTGGLTVTAGGLTVSASGANITGGIVLASSGNIDGNGGTSGQLRIGGVIVNAANFDGTEEFLVSGESRLKGAVTITTGGLDVQGTATADMVTIDGTGTVFTLIGTSQTQTTVGGAGGASALPATPRGYIKTSIGGADRVIAFYDP